MIAVSGIFILILFLIAGNYLTPQPQSEKFLQDLEKSRGVANSSQGLIWKNACECFITPREFYRDVSRAFYVLIGEIHNNNEHHRFQSFLTYDLMSTKKMSLGFEMMESNDNDRIQYLSDLSSVWRWTQDSYDDYKSIVDVALNYRGTIFGANVPKTIMEFAKMNGLESTLSPAIRDVLYLTEQYPEHFKEVILSRILPYIKYHTHFSFDRYVDAQRLRDAHMAAQLIQNRKKDGAILIAGRFHTYEGGVTWYLKKHAPTTKIATIGLFEEPEMNKEEFEKLLRSFRRTSFDFVVNIPKL